MLLRQTRGIYLGMFLTACILLAATLLFRPAARSVFSPSAHARPVVVIDAGHGGPDGGAVSNDGIIESRLNLEIARRLSLLLLFCGQDVSMTRTDDADCSLLPDTASIKNRKVADLKNRAAAVNSMENAVLLSIHQNSLAGHPGVYGAQAFFNAVPGSNGLAQSIQQALNQAHNQGNAKNARQIDSSIYLMSAVQHPAVLVECGFLSNANEAHALCTAGYQMQIVLSIAAGYLTYSNEGSA